MRREGGREGGEERGRGGEKEEKLGGGDGDCRREEEGKDVRKREMKGEGCTYTGM